MSDSTQQQQQQNRLKFVPFSSAMELSFWVHYNRLKLETIQLSEAPLDILASYGSFSDNNNKKSGGGAMMTASSSSSATTTTTSSFPKLQLHEHSLVMPQQQQQQQQDPSQSAAAAAAAVCTTTTTLANERCRARGILVGYNTVESFQTVNKNELLRDIFCRYFFAAAAAHGGGGGGEEEDENNAKDAVVVSSLNMFVLITYCDLKNHKVVYWFGFPAALAPIATISTTDETEEPPRLFTDVYSPAVALDLAHQFHALRLLLQQQQQHQPAGSAAAAALPSYFLWIPNAQKCIPLSKQNYYTQQQKQQQQQQVIVFGFLDPSTTPDPGWPLRNLVAYLTFHLALEGQTVRILSYRPGRVRRLPSTNSTTAHTTTTTTTTTTAHDSTLELDQAHNTSLVFDIRVPTKHDFGWTAEQQQQQQQPSLWLKVAGWELNARSKAGPRQVDLRPLLDEHHLAVQAADLNLKLMKWRMIPDLNVERLQQTRILILGAGTLGCNVARTCLGWGFRHFTFVDNGTVQYSNPVRQPLFTLADCKSTSSNNNKGLPKAIAAANALKLIAPDVQATGIVLSIPMPGHVESHQVIASAVQTLDALIQDANVVFLLTDTRESRWLPTVMTAAASSHDNKILINAALGLDSWLVMRHGHSYDVSVCSGNTSSSSTLLPPPTTTKTSRLGCYFCNDVVAPENSQKNRTLDQQCTVTRPGLAPIASSMAVELLVALLHHPKRAAAPAPPRMSSHFSPTLNSSSNDNDNDNSSSFSSALGLLPHQVRGSLVTYTIMTPSVPAFVHCTACAPAVIQAYRTNSVAMVHEACSCPTSQYLEDLAGLTQFRLQAAAAQLSMDDFCDDEDEDAWNEENA